MFLTYLLDLILLYGMVNVVPLALALIKKTDLATFYHDNLNLLLGPPIIFLICIFVDAFMGGAHGSIRSEAMWTSLGICLIDVVNAIRYLFRKGEHVPVENAIADRLERWWKRHSRKSGESK